MTCVLWREVGSSTPRTPPHLPPAPCLSILWDPLCNLEIVGEAGVLLWLTEQVEMGKRAAQAPPARALGLQVMMMVRMVSGLRAGLPGTAFSPDQMVDSPGNPNEGPTLGCRRS